MMDEEWEYSPRSTILAGDLTLLPPFLVDDEPHGVSLENFIREVPNVVKDRQLRGIPAGSEEDPIQNLFGRLNLERRDWERFAHFDPLKPYTRNLVASDGKTYTLLVLCWNGESPIHDHPCDGCWARVLQGSVRECRYQKVDGSDKLLCTQETVMEEGEVMFMEDSMGYHKIGCTDLKQPSVTLHLYTPPYQSCKIFLNGTRKSSEATVCFYSINGVKVQRCGT
ncbi:hypothetical protein MPSEU_000611400 [Mayamaea pseudoterrestris]|nr:hypothetical protein MPSEU_000611400 [Mayamaea pseudoterrestris]